MLRKLLLPAQITFGVLAAVFGFTAFLVSFISVAYSRASDFPGMLCSALFLLFYLILVVLLRKSRGFLIAFLALSLVSVYGAVSPLIVSAAPHVSSVAQPVQPDPFVLSAVLYAVLIVVILVFTPMYGFSYLFQSAYGDFYKDSFYIFYLILVLLLLAVQLFFFIRLMISREKQSAAKAEPGDTMTNGASSRIHPLHARVVTGVAALLLFAASTVYSFLSLCNTRPSDVIGLLLSVLFLAAYVAFLLLFRRVRSVLILSLVVSLYSLLTAASFWNLQFHSYEYTTGVISNAWPVFAPLYGLSCLFQSYEGFLQRGAYLIFYFILIFLLLAFKLFLLIRLLKSWKKQSVAA